MTFFYKKAYKFYKQNCNQWLFDKKLTNFINRVLIKKRIFDENVFNHEILQKAYRFCKQKCNQNA
jgi:hypothetical protein